MKLDGSVVDELITKAGEMMKMSYAPYSDFNVGAALLCDDGSIYTGCNIENASYGATNCAERTAIFKAVSEGHKSFSAIAIAGGAHGVVQKVCPPCGICRQVLSEFCDKDMPVYLIREGGYDEYTLKELFPLSFDLKISDGEF